MTLAEKILNHDIRAAARLMRNLDDRLPEAIEDLKLLYLNSGNAYTIGITGPPGVGKSTIIDKLIEKYRYLGFKVGVIVIDPTSPFSGGAILGDRIRMQRHSTDKGVFIRSVATRGYLGGISRSTWDIMTVMDAMGFDIILIETVGVGQDEIEISNLVDTTILVTVPGLGDEIQVIKAGIMEIADIFVINKADREDAQKTLNDIKWILELKEKKKGEWEPKIFLVQGNINKGIDELINGIDEHKSFILGKKREEHLEIKALSQLKELIKEKVLDDIFGILKENNLLKKIISDITLRNSDPYTVVDSLIKLYKS